MTKAAAGVVCMTLRLPRKQADYVIAQAAMERRSRNEWISIYLEKKIAEEVNFKAKHRDQINASAERNSL